MGLEWNEAKRQYEWTGSVRDLVSAVGSGDARLGFVVDKASGAKISMNINGTDDEEATEPFYIEAPDGDNLYDAGNRKEAVNMLTAARRGERDLDMFIYESPKPKSKPKAKSTRKKRSGGSGSISMGGLR